MEFSYLIFTNIFIVMRAFVQSVAIITIFAVVTRAIGFFFRIFLSRILGPEMLGVYQLAMSFFMVFLTVVASGLPLAISKRVATGHTRGVISAGLVISLTLSLIACAVVMLFGHLFAPLFTDARCVQILICLIPSTIAGSVYCVVRAVWWGQKRFFLLGATELLEQVLRIVVFAVMLSFAFLFVDMAMIASLSYTVAFAIATVIVVIIFVKVGRINGSKNPPKNPEKTPLKRGGKTPPEIQKNTLFEGGFRTQFKPLLRSATPITGVRLVTALTVPIISVLIIQRLVAVGWDNTVAMASFGILMGMTMPILGIPQTVIGSLSTALVPELSTAHSSKKTANVQAQINNALKFTIFINYICIPVFMAVGTGIGLFIFDNAMSGDYIMWFAWAMIPMSLSSITNAILNSLGAEARAMKHYFIGAVFLFAGIWFLPKYVGISALVFGISACMAIASVLNLMLIKKLAGVATIKTTVCQIVAFSAVTVPSALLGYFSYGVLIHCFDLFFTLCVCGTVTLGSFLILCHVFKIIELNVVIAQIRHKD